MKKAPQAFRTISEVSEWLDTPTHVLRFWESKFSQIKPVKRAGGRRYYRPEDMKLLGGIKTLLHGEGITIKGVQKMLSEKGVKHVSEMSPELEFAKRKRRKKSGKKDIEKPSVSTSTVSSPDAAASSPPKTTPAPSADTAATPNTAQPVLKRPVEQDARDRINAAVNRPTNDDQGDDTARPAALGANFSPRKARADINDTDYSDLEDLFYALRKVRNRMKRALNALP